MTGEGVKVMATNRKAAHDYFLEDRLEAGIRAGRVSLKEAYVRVADEEAWLVNAHIAPYDPASSQNHDPRRPRKLLLHRKQIQHVFEQLRQRGYTLVPTKLYLKSGRAKVEVALARGKRQYDKRHELARREADREIQRTLTRKTST